MVPVMRHPSKRTCYICFIHFIWEEKQRDEVFSHVSCECTRQKGDEERLSHLSSLRSHLSEMDLTLEDGRGPVVHALALDGSKAPLLCSESQQRSGWTH
ncbi:hypothetical protein GBF38_015000 [Nibea albiflora]|uniref:Uncharacterized protein n=1 Tax=Nibea albiflora TaxID=240163 RepID=A0ACB7EK98_NIBAL|nr:hypothetical protein GBF38_015000 [Nibea albiflora]